MIVHGLDIASAAEVITRDLPFGLWCVDFRKQTITGYNKFCDLLNAPSTLKLSDLTRLIRKDYRDMIQFAFDDIHGKDSFELVFPTNNRWVEMKLTHFDDETDKAYGYIIEYHRESIKDSDIDHLTMLMHQQNLLIHEVFNKVYIDHYNDTSADLMVEIRKLLKADRVSVIEYNHVNKTISCTYESTDSKVKPLINAIQNQGFEKIEWIHKEVMQNKTVYVYDLSELPNNKRLQTQTICNIDTQSIFIQPLTFRDNVIGFLIINFIKNKYPENALETDWLKAMSRFIEFSINLKNKQRYQDSEKERLRCIMEMSPFGNLHLRFEYDADNKPHDLSIVATNTLFEKMLNIENIKGKLISEVFGAEATHIFEKCVAVAETKQQTIIDDFIYYNGVAYAGGIIMSSDREFVCVITQNPTILYNRKKENNINLKAMWREMQHLLRTHLNAIVGFAELMATDNNEQNKSKYMEIIKDNAQSLIDSTFIKDSLNSNEEEANKPQNTAGNTARKKILIAEDTESNYMLVSYILKSLYDIEWAHDGVEALEMYEKSKPDLILMDVRMPRLGGLSATSRIRETDKDTPIIALTAFAFENDRAKTLEAGCTNFLAKPIKAAALKEMVAKYIGE